MPKFSYKALDARGQVKSGIVEATDKAAAETELQRSGVKIQHLDMLREGPGPASGAMRPNLPVPPSGAARAAGPASGAMRAVVPPAPPAGGTRPAPPAPPRTFPSGEKPPVSEPAPPRPARQDSPSGTIPRPAPLASLAPEPPEPGPPTRLAPAEPPPAAPAPPPADPVPAASLARPLLALAIVALWLAFLTVAALTRPTAPARPSPTASRQTITLSGHLPKLPANAVVVFHFPQGKDVERPVSALDVGPDGLFEVALEVEARPDTFQVRARRPGQRDLISPVGRIQHGSGTLTGELSVEKKVAEN